MNKSEIKDVMEGIEYSQSHIQNAIGMIEWYILHIKDELKYIKSFNGIYKKAMKKFLKQLKDKEAANELQKVK